MLASRPDGSRLHLPAWIVERLAFEPERAAAKAAAHGEACPSCRAAIEELRRARDAFLEARPARPFVARVRESAQLRGAAVGRSRWLRSWMLAAGAAAAAAMVIVTVRGPGQPATDVRFKGDGIAALAVFVSRGGEAARPLEPGEALHPGDVVRFGVVSARRGHALVVGIDERGRYFRYHPAAPAASAAVDGREHLQVLPGSVVLDDALGREWIALVVSGQPLDEARVEEALLRAWQLRDGDRLGPVALDAEVRVVSVVKVPP